MREGVATVEVTVLTLGEATIVGVMALLEVEMEAGDTVVEVIQVGVILEEAILEGVILVVEILAGVILEGVILVEVIAITNRVMSWLTRITQVICPILLVRGKNIQFLTAAHLKSIAQKHAFRA